MGDPVESLRALRKRSPWAGPAICPACHHESHAGHYCFVVPVRGMGRGHYCGCDQRDKEKHHGTDSPASRDSRGAAVPGGDAQGRAPVTTIQDVDRAWDALTEACDRYTARRGAS